MVDFKDFAEGYQYPVIEFQENHVTWANACARMLLGQRLNNLNNIFEGDDIQSILHAFRENEEWRGKAVVGDITVAADLVVYNGRGYITIRPDEYKKGFLMDQMLSDMGQLMKDPLNNMFSAIKDLDDPEMKDNAVAVIKHSFYNLVRLSENQIAVTPTASHVDLTLVPIVDFVQNAIASVNETLGDKGVTIELAEKLSEEQFCNVHPQKLTHLLMLLISNAVRGIAAGSTISVDLHFDGNTCFICIPVSGKTISLYDSSAYLAAVGTPESLDSLENLTLAKIVNAFNEIHESRVFTTTAKDGRNIVVLAIESTNRGTVGEYRYTPSGLRPDLIFLSDILDKNSYM